MGALALALLIAACGGGGDGGGQDGKTGADSANPALQYGQRVDIANLNPAKGISQPETWLAYEPLLQIEPDGSIGPGLATSWRLYKTSNGPNTGFELKLRDDARFSDDTPVTADAVVTWLEYFLRAGGSYSTYLGPNPTFRSDGKLTVQIRVKTPNPEIPFVLAADSWGFVASPRAVADPSLLASQTYGAGPYELDPSRTVSGDHYTYKPNPHYHDKSAIKFSSVTMKVITSQSTMLQALRAGQIDVGAGAANTAGAAAAAGLDVITGPANILRLVLPSRDAKPLSDLRVRQALNYAIDRAAIVKSLMYDKGAPTSAIVTTNGSDPSLDDRYAYDPEKAKSLLAEAGYGDGLTLKVVGFPATEFDNQAILQAIAQNLSAIGVSLEITEPVSQADFVNKVKSKDVQMFLHPSIILPMGNFYAVNLSPNGSWANTRGLHDPVIDKLYNASLLSSDPHSDYVKMTQRMTEQADFVPIATEDAIQFASKKIGGVSVTTAAGGYSIPTEWFPKK